MEWIEIVRNLGFPTAFCLALGMGAWRCCAYLGPRIDAWVDRLVTSHEALTKSCITIGESNSATLRKLEVISGDQASALGRVETLIRRFTNQPSA